MVKEALRGYVSLASGLTEITAGRARAAARSLVEQGEATAGQVSALAEDLIATSRRNRESLLLLVRHEVEQAVRRLGVGASSDVETLTTRVRELERSLRELRHGALSPSGKRAAPGKSPITETAAPGKKSTAAKQAAAGKKAPPAKKSPAKKSPPATKQVVATKKATQPKKPTQPKKAATRSGG
jgi:polyhydroxyalkanoate synthesis regulator phasin